MGEPLDGLTVRTMREDDAVAADRVLRFAFGTYLGLPDPASFGGDGDFVATRRRTFPDGAFVAERASEVVGSSTYASTSASASDRAS